MPNEEQEAQVRQQERWNRAITISILAILASGILMFAATDALFLPQGGCSQRTACAANLRCIDGAKATWALENKKDTNAVPTDAELFGNALYLREKPGCPANGIYTLGSVSQKPRCSIPGHTI